jgi:hypothetical protein
VNYKILNKYQPPLKNQIRSLNFSSSLSEIFCSACFSLASSSLKRSFLNSDNLTSTFSYWIERQSIDSECFLALPLTWPKTQQPSSFSLKLPAALPLLFCASMLTLSRNFLVLLKLGFGLQCLSLQPFQGLVFVPKVGVILKV